MGEFFKGWRRKMGEVTLILATLNVLAWVSSLVSEQSFVAQYAASNAYVIISGDASLAFALATDLGSHREGFADKAAIGILDHDLMLSGMIWPGSVDGKHKRRHVRSGFFATSNVSFRFYGFLLPYWSIVVPLTLLSAYLLLVKPRVAKPRIIGEIRL